MSIFLLLLLMASAFNRPACYLLLMDFEERRRIFHPVRERKHDKFKGIYIQNDQVRRGGIFSSSSFLFFHDAKLQKERIDVRALFIKFLANIFPL